MPPPTSFDPSSLLDLPLLALSFFFPRPKVSLPCSFNFSPLPSSPYLIQFISTNDIAAKCSHRAQLLLVTANLKKFKD